MPTLNFRCNYCKKSIMIRVVDVGLSGFELSFFREARFSVKVFFRHSMYLKCMWTGVCCVIMQRSIFAIQTIGSSSLCPFAGSSCHCRSDLWLRINLFGIYGALVYADMAQHVTVATACSLIAYVTCELLKNFTGTILKHGWTVWTGGSGKI